jgi:Flp pilus assembly protein TadG
VEFALVLPFLLLLCLALVQIGVLGRDQLLLVQAARAGSRQAVVDPEDGAVRSAALEAAPGLDPARVEVTVDRTGGLGQPVEVTVGYRARIAVPLAGLFFPSEVRLEASTAMRQEFP